MHFSWVSHRGRRQRRRQQQQDGEKGEEEGEEEGQEEEGEEEGPQLAVHRLHLEPGRLRIAPCLLAPVKRYWAALAAHYSVGRLVKSMFLGTAIPPAAGVSLTRMELCCR